MRMRAFCLALPLLLASGFAEAAVKIKLGTLAPNGSTWHMLLKEMGQKFEQVSGGQVKVTIYPGGVQGNEGDMVKKTRINQLQAVALTTIGLHEIAPEPQAVDVPMMVESFEALDHVMAGVEDKLNKSIEQKGYVVLGWSEVGFVRFFSTKPYASMKDFTEKAKIFGWEGDPASIDAWRAGGFKPVVMSSTEIVSGLQTGLIDSVALAPLYAFSSRIFERAKYMLDLPWAVLTGATVVRKETWDQVPADLKPKLIEIARDYSKKIADEVRKMDDDALKQMKAQGLQVVKPVDEAAFRKAAIETWSVIRGKVVPAPIFDEVKRLVAEFKAKKK